MSLKQQRFFKFCLLLTAYCLLLTAYCLLLTAYCLLLTAYCLLLAAYCLLLAACCLLLAACCLLLASCCFLLAACCLLLAACCLLLTAYCLLPTTPCIQKKYNIFHPQSDVAGIAQVPWRDSRPTYSIRRWEFYCLREHSPIHWDDGRWNAISILDGLGRYSDKAR